jgi:AICAR transformylase/IMP cyclohydrolase PurH
VVSACRRSRDVATFGRLTGGPYALGALSTILRPVSTHNPTANLPAVDLVPVKRALISVSDKTGLDAFATALVKEFNVELISTGGTAKYLRGLGLSVKDVSDVTGFPEMMDGRVKTLHPMVHGGLLALRDHPEHAAAMKQHGIQPIDLVCINLYPFEQTIAKPGVTFDEAIENIDIGGPSMVRSAAKNHRYVLVVTSPERYEKVLGDLRKHNGSSCAQHRRKMAQLAFAQTARYDRMIADYLEKQLEVPGKPQTGGGPARHLPFREEGAVAVSTVQAPPPAQPSRSDADSGATARAKLVQRLVAAEPNLPNFMQDLIYAQALTVNGTEAAGFTIVPGVETDRALQNVAHVRQDDSPVEVRQQAVLALAELVKPCLLQEKDGALALGPAGDNSPDQQYCLVTLLRSEGNVVAVSAVITRCVDEERAYQRLDAMRLIAGFHEMYQLRRKLETVDVGSSPLHFEGSGALPATLRGHYTLQQSLRYGENPHQKAAVYVSHNHPQVEASVARAKQHHGKELSYINLLDADGALSAVKEFTDQPAACIVKHATPCGVAVGGDVAEAFVKAYDSDPIAAFGGIVAVNRPIDLAAAQRIADGQKFLEVIVAPGYASDALELLKQRWKNVRLLEVAGSLKPDGRELSMHNIVGGILIQERDLVGVVEGDWKVVTKRQPTPAELADLKFAWVACKHVKSNAIVIARGGATVGIGGGQVDRVGASQIAIRKAGERAKGGAVASDAFFPFPDGPKSLLAAGVTAIVQPGGSVRDAETIAAMDDAGAAMVFTGRRHFRH